MYISPPSIGGTLGYVVDSYYGYGSAVYGLVMDGTTTSDIPDPLLIKTTGAVNHTPVTVQVMNAGVANRGVIDVLDLTGANLFTVDQLGQVFTPDLIISGVGPGSIRSATSSNNFLDADGASGQWTMRAGATPTTVYTATATAFSVSTPLDLLGIASSAGSGGLYVCVDTSGVTYKKSSCP